MGGSIHYILDPWVEKNERGTRKPKKNCKPSMFSNLKDKAINTFSFSKKSKKSTECCENSEDTEELIDQSMSNKEEVINETASNNQEAIDETASNRQELVKVKGDEVENK